MILGTGLDIVQVTRIEKAARNKLFYTKNFTPGEIKLFESRPNAAETAAGNFAVKEAVLKCLGCGIFDMPLCDIEVLREDTGRPYVNLTGKAREKADELGIKRMHISISHTGGFAAGQAVAEGE